MSLFRKLIGSRAPRLESSEADNDFTFKDDVEISFAVRRKSPDAPEMKPLTFTVPEGQHDELLKFIGKNDLTMSDLLRMTNSIGFAVIEQNPALIWFFKQGRRGELPKSFAIRF